MKTVSVSSIETALKYEESASSHVCALLRLVLVAIVCSGPIDAVAVYS